MTKRSKWVNLLLEGTKWTIIPQLWFEDGLEVSFKSHQETSARIISGRKQRTILAYFWWSRYQRSGCKGMSREILDAKLKKHTGDR
jgi:hypothetical protein